MKLSALTSWIYSYSPQLLNFHARSITQSATVSNKLANQPYTAAGLRGDGQIVTVADTGIDVSSCYFYDSAGRVQPSLPSAPIFNQGMRKIIGYIYNSCGDQTDTSGGHGTHVSGTVAGYIANSDLGGGKNSRDDILHIAYSFLCLFNLFSNFSWPICWSSSKCENYF